MTEERKVMFRRYHPLTFIQTDKPIYIPGQTGRQGMYKLKAYIGDRMISHDFEVKKYVLPKFEVTVTAPKRVSIDDELMAVEVCGKYTYGQPVSGKSWVKMCRDILSYSYRQDKHSPRCVNETTEIKLSNFKGAPIQNKVVYLLEGETWSSKLLLNLTTDSDGLALLIHLVFRKKTLILMANVYPAFQHHGYKTPFYSTDRKTVQLLRPVTPYTPTLSELIIENIDQPLKCDAEFTVTIKYYFIGQTAEDYKTDIVYMVLSRGVIVHHGYEKVEVKSSNGAASGTLSFKLSIGADLAPAVQILTYCVLPSENVIARSNKFDIKKCFKNKIFNLLPVQSVSDYPYSVEDEQECLHVRPRRAVLTDNAFEYLKSVGLKMATNLVVRFPQCLVYKSSAYNRNDDIDYSLKASSDDQYSSCLCANGRKTFKWILTPSVLGVLNFTVSAEAESSQTVCDNEIVSVPERGRIDRSGQAEGTEKTETYSWLLCPKGDSLSEEVELTLPKDVIEGSARSSVSVIDISMERTENMILTYTIGSIKFIDLPEFFEKGSVIQAKVKVEFSKGTPFPYFKVVVEHALSQSQELTTDINGLADFTIDTSLAIRTSIYVSARASSNNQFSTPYHFDSARKTLQLKPKESPAKVSQLVIKALEEPLKCEEEISVTVQYTVAGETAESGSVTIVYLVSLRFSPTTAVPGEENILQISAQPGYGFMDFGCPQAYPDAKPGVVGMPGPVGPMGPMGPPGPMGPMGPGGSAR
ncbi:hypothetical protein cypCar_00037440, partial [Cyprinus carpio]